jgi:hypothetical protein
MSWCASHAMEFDLPLPAECWISVGEQLSNDVELVVTGEDLHRSLLARPFVLPLDHLCVVLKDVGQTLRRQDPLPQVVRLQTIRIRRVASSVIPALVEGQEPRRIALELGAHAYLVVVYREVNHTAPKLEESLASITVPFVLLHRVGDRLLRQAVLQLERDDRQTIDEEA